MLSKTMASFSERYGFKPSKNIQIESMDDDLRTGIWNVLHKHFWSQYDYYLFRYDYGSQERHESAKTNRSLISICMNLWLDFFKCRVDAISHQWESLYEQVEEGFFQIDWNRVYDFLEFIAPLGESITGFSNDSFKSDCNRILEREKSAYGFVAGRIAPITSAIEMSEIEEATSTPFDPINYQIKNALILLSNRENPDYRNSIKESISAVETAVRIINNTPKATLSSAIMKLKKKIEIHPDLEEGFKKIYNYTSDAHGFRHGLMNQPNVPFHDAKFMLVACSAFVNLLIAKAQEAGIVDK
jgi:hypothetical protein